MRVEVKGEPVWRGLSRLFRAGSKLLGGFSPNSWVPLPTKVVSFFLRASAGSVTKQLVYEQR